MRSWRSALGLGFLAWLVPFVIAFLVFPFRESARPLFESIMAVTVTATAVVLGLVYLSKTDEDIVKEGIMIGLLWLAICILIDAPLMLVAGPMKMAFGAYMADIGLTYVSIPVVTWGLAMAHALKRKPHSDTAGSSSESMELPGRDSDIYWMHRCSQ